MSGVLLGVSIPVFWLGFMLVYALAVLPEHVGLDLFPISGRIGAALRGPGRGRTCSSSTRSSPATVPRLASALWHLVLPSITLGTIPLAIVAKITRSGMLEVLRSDYVRTARAKGLGPGAVLVRHALRNALVPILTVVGLQTGLLLGGAVLTESIFAWPGVGRLAFDAISKPGHAARQRLRAALRGRLRHDSTRSSTSRTLRRIRGSATEREPVAERISRNGSGPAPRTVKGRNLESRRASAVCHRGAPRTRAKRSSIATFTW